MNIFFKYIYNKYAPHGVRWLPLLAFYYLTNDCNFRCPYCATGPFLMERPDGDHSALPGTEVLRLIGVIRRHTGYLVITGGEALTHPDFGYVIANVGRFRFNAVILATNGYLLDRHGPAISRAVDTVVISLDTLDEEKSAAYSGVEGSLPRVLANIDMLSDYPGMKRRISISSVITSDNIGDLYDVFHYAQDRGFEFAANPQLLGVKSHPDLVDSQEYRRFYDFLIERKKRGARIYGTIYYLRVMRDLGRFNCYPLAMMVVSPSGHVYYPCLEGGAVAGNLLDEPDLNILRERAAPLNMGAASCGERCHSGCMLGVSLALEHPISLLPEVFYFLARGVRRGGGAR